MPAADVIKNTTTGSSHQKMRFGNILCSTFFLFLTCDGFILRSNKYRLKKASSFGSCSRSFSLTTTPATTSSTDDFVVDEGFQLSHVMLKVPSVQNTVDYWIEKGGTIVRSSEKEDGTLKSAFVALGGSDDRTPEDSFALELVELSDFDMGNCISYIGVSMLLQFQNNLVGAAAGEKPLSEGEEPNSIPVKSSASAPGDYFARFCLKTNDLVATNEFYSDIMGMEIVAIDEDMVCLRYENDATEKAKGVPTTLVFEKTTEELKRGNCFDHIVITSNANVDTEYERIQNEGGTIFMKPANMFGTKLFGIRDPNGYKVIVTGK